MLLHSHNWALDRVMKMYSEDSSNLLICSKLKPEKSPSAKSLARVTVCPICVMTLSRDVYHSLSCGHHFCKGCWNIYLETQVMNGVSTGKLDKIYLHKKHFFYCGCSFSDWVHGMSSDGNWRLCLTPVGNFPVERAISPAFILRLRKVASGIAILSRSKLQHGHKSPREQSEASGLQLVSHNVLVTFLKSNIRIFKTWSILQLSLRRGLPRADRLWNNKKVANQMRWR